MLERILHIFESVITKVVASFKKAVYSPSFKEFLHNEPEIKMLKSITFAKALYQLANAKICDCLTPTFLRIMFYAKELPLKDEFERFQVGHHH